MRQKRLWTVVLVGAMLLSACGDGGNDPQSTLVPTPDPNPQPDPPEPVSCDEGPFVSSGSMRLLTRFEYDNTIRDLLGEDARLAQDFPPENRTGVFENDARAHAVSPLLIQRYVETSETLADRVDLAVLVDCDAEIEGEGVCGQRFVTRFTSRAFRRPALGQEQAIFNQLFADTLASAGYEEALRRVIQGVLQSPQFLYRLEQIEDGEPEEGTIIPITGYEMASRLSYFLWSSMPDDALFEAAQRGELTTPEQIEAQAQRMLVDPKSFDTVSNFHRQWLGLESLSSITKDATAFPGFSDAIKEDWRISLEAYVEHVFSSANPTVEALFSDPTLMLTPEMAELYDIQIEGPVEMVEHAAPEERAGLLTQPALLALLAHPDQGSPIMRGVFVRERILCQTLQPPPPGQDLTPPDPKPDATTRERFAEHTANDECAGCHLQIDPIGFGFEDFDGIGRWRDQENGEPIDASGELVGVAEASVQGGFEGAVELSEKLAGSDIVRDCVTEQWFTYALGRLPQGLDTCALDALQEEFSGTDGNIYAMLAALVRTDAFRYRVAQGQASEEDAP